MSKNVERRLAEFIDAVVDAELANDEIYLRNMTKLEKIKEKLNQEFNEKQQQLVEEYTNCLFSLDIRSCYIAYLTAIKNIIQFIAK